jgi:peptide/nickel transport system permease protein
MAGSTLASPSADTGGAVRVRLRYVSPGREAWRRFRRHRMALVSGAILAAIVLAILVGPFVWRVAINEIDFAARLQGPSWQHPLGTDDLGQDLLARMLYGGRISLAVGLAAMVVAVVVGTLIGAERSGLYLGKSSVEN